VEAAVVDATERLLGSGATFTELGVQRIAEAAGIARSTFYLYFRDKTDLMVRLADDLGREAFAAAGEVTPDLDGITRAHLDVLAFYRRRAHVLAAVTEVAGYEPAVRDVWQAAVERFADNLAALLHAEQQAGRTSADLDPRTAAEVIVWSGIRVIVHQITTRGPQTDAAVARELAANQWYGAFRRPTTG
jgi:AcrR family transcriptional regulator